MIDKSIVEALKLRYKDLHPLIFKRSVEHATSAGNLFDILEGIPNKFPIFWCNDNKIWMQAKDITLRKGFMEK